MKRGRPIEFCTHRPLRTKEDDRRNRICFFFAEQKHKKLNWIAVHLHTRFDRWCIFRFLQDRQKKYEQIAYEIIGERERICFHSCVRDISMRVSFVTKSTTIIIFETKRKHQMNYYDLVHTACSMFMLTSIYSFSINILRFSLSCCSAVARSGRWTQQAIASIARQKPKHSTQFVSNSAISLSPLPM